MDPGRQFQQLDMFRPAHELRAIPGTFRNAVGDPARLQHAWGDKLHEAKTHPFGYSRSLHADIRSNGIDNPVWLTNGNAGKDVIVDGHHRAAVAHDINPDYLVPVKHHGP